MVMILRNLIQKLLPADFSQEPEVAFKEDFNEGGWSGAAVDDQDQRDDYDYTDQDQPHGHGDYHDNHNLTVITSIWWI